MSEQMFPNRQIDWSAPSQQESGTYVCAACGESLFDANQKFDSKTGFPSFWAHLQDHVAQKPLHTYGRHRIQLVCHKCGQHLGHLFDDARTPSQVRYCINTEAILLQKKQEAIDPESSLGGGT